MNRPIDESHDPALRSWVESANRPSTDFPIQNLPFGVFKTSHDSEGARIGVAIGDQVLDLARCGQLGLLDELSSDVRDALVIAPLNRLMGLGPRASRTVRRHLVTLLKSDSRRAEPRALVPMEAVELAVPAHIGDYSDFYASVFHATHVGSLFRPDNPLMPNYKYVPVAYHGRASSIVASGTPVRRPYGQTKGAQQAAPSFGPSRMLDYEVEVGLFVGRGNSLGSVVPVEDAEDHLFGLCLLNDWSARDIQAWEYQPLGPFLSKSFATTVSPWVVTLEALAPFRCPAFRRATGDPEPLPHLASTSDRRLGGIDVQLDALVRSARMREQRLEPVRFSRSSLRDIYWTVSQMVAHHTSNGCNLRSGDLIGTGTVSGPSDAELGCLLELTRQGSRSVSLPTGEQRGYLEDGDEVIIRGCCEREGFARIGWGACSGVIVATPGSEPASAA